MFAHLTASISIHALVKRATCRADTDFPALRHFNPRPREEGDMYDAAKDALDKISIHALVKRATDVTIAL